jgi:hypothetical protein
LFALAVADEKFGRVPERFTSAEAVNIKPA